MYLIYFDRGGSWIFIGGGGGAKDYVPRMHINNMVDQNWGGGGLAPAVPPLDPQSKSKDWIIVFVFFSRLFVMIGLRIAIVLQWSRAF